VKVLVYFSRKLHGAETRYSTYDKELLAIRDALKHWRYYLLGRHTTISTDHPSLRHMLGQPKLSQRQIRALEDMLEYDFDIEYLPGAKNYVQDALSRRRDYKEPPITQIHSAKSGQSTYERDGDFVYRLVESASILGLQRKRRNPSPNFLTWY
jgi:putative transposase